MNKVRIVPAILTDDPGQLEDMVRRAESFTDWVQVDIMDGQFVPSRSLAAEHLAAVSPRFKWEAHLMVKEPERYLRGFREAGASKAVFHYEATSFHRDVIKQARSLGLGVGLAVNPETTVASVLPLAGLVDSVLFLSVHPGFYGAAFLPEVLDRVTELRRLKPGLELGIDGGVKESNIARIARTGVNDICVGSAIFRQEDPGAAFRHLAAVANEGR